MIPGGIMPFLSDLQVFGEDEIKKEGYIMVVIVVVVGGVEIVENPKYIDGVSVFSHFFINIFT